MNTPLVRACFALLLVVVCMPCTQTLAQSSEFKNGFPQDPSFFPIGVWMQETHRAEAYKQIGVNTFVGLWAGPREEQLADLARAGLFAIANQNDVGLSSANSSVIKAWLQLDEPDNAQSRPEGGWGDCIMPEAIKASFVAIRSRDPTRPVFLNFGQGVVNKPWVGRGDTCAKIDHDTYYGAASRGADILSFDIYPVAEVEQQHVAGRLEFVGDGVAQLKKWASPAQPVWAFIETTHINNPNKRATGAEIRSMTWMAVIRGARGITYFAHEWQPSPAPDAIFRYPEILAGVTLLNAELTRLAPVINRGSEIPVSTDTDKIAAMARRHGNSIYLFAANVTGAPTSAQISAPGLVSKTGSVLGEQRFLTADNDSLGDNFSPYGVHLYVFPD